MGNKFTALSNSLASSISQNNFTQFSQLLHDVGNINGCLSISSDVCTKLRIPSDWDPPVIHLVCFFKKKNFLIFLLSSFEDADVNVQDQFGFTALMRSVKTGCQGIIGILLDRGADILKANQYDSGDTALHYACEKGDLKIAVMLLNKTKIIDIENSEGMTPLIYAVQKKHEKLIEKLLEMGADPYIPDKSQKSALDYAKNLGFSSKILERFSNFSYLKKNDSNDASIIMTDRTIIQDPEDHSSPSTLAKAVFKTLDILITNQITWTKDS